jgi:hypothetical protein
MKNALIKALVRWAWGDDARIAQLESWLDSAVEAIAQGQGNIQSSSVNGVLISNFSSGLTNTELVVILSKVIGHLEDGSFPSSTTLAKVTTL